MIKIYNYLFITTIHIQLYPAIFVCVNYYVPYQCNGDRVLRKLHCRYLCSLTSRKLANSCALCCWRATPPLSWRCLQH